MQYPSFPIILTIIVPLYNLEEYIADCLESILQIPSGLGNYEIIVWNDGSIDKSEKIVNEFIERFPNKVILENHKNHGVSYSRNKALERANGKYIWFVDGDDCIMPENVMLLLKQMQDNFLDLLQFNYKDLFSDGRINDSIFKQSESEVMSGRDLFLSQKLNMAPWAYIYRREFLQENKILFPEDFKTCEDIQFNQKALFFAKRSMISSMTAYYYRHRDVSATQGQARRVTLDQARRMPLAIDFFSLFNDNQFLESIIFKNAREIVVWMRWTDMNKEDYKAIKTSARYALSKCFFPFRFSFFYLLLLSYCPATLCSFQKIINKVKRLSQ